MYTPNNIRFRIVSCNSIAQFKLDQAFDFNELINNKEFSFSEESRETLLLNYELWFKFICRLERVFIRSKAPQEPIGIISDHIAMLANDTISDLADVVHSHPVIFNSYINPIVIRSQSVFLEYFFKIFEETSSQSVYVAFPNIVNAVSGMLHNLLFVLHEIEHLKNKRPNAFLSFTDMITGIVSKMGAYPTLHRAKIYRDIFGINKFYIKNYSCGEVNEKLIEFLIEDGFELLGVETLADANCSLEDDKHIAYMSTNQKH